MRVTNHPVYRYLFLNNNNATECLNDSDSSALHEHIQFCITNLYETSSISTLNNLQVTSWGISDMFDDCMTKHFMVMFGSCKL